jgi:hypothetical protein
MGVTEHNPNVVVQIGSHLRELCRTYVGAELVWIRMTMHQSIGVVCEFCSLWELGKPLSLTVTQLPLGEFKPCVGHFIMFVTMRRFNVAIVVAPYDE